MSETKRENSPPILNGRNMMGSLFALLSSNSPKYSKGNEDPQKPELPFKFYSDGSYELKY